MKKKELREELHAAHTYIDRLERDLDVAARFGNAQFARAEAAEAYFAPVSSTVDPHRNDAEQLLATLGGTVHITPGGAS